MSAPKTLLHKPHVCTDQYAIFQAVKAGDLRLLKYKMEGTTDEVRSEMLHSHWLDIHGTLHLGSVKSAVDKSNDDFCDPAAAEKHAACADYLRSLGAPCQRFDCEDGVANPLLCAGWDTRPARHVVEHLLRASLEAGHFQVNKKLSDQVPRMRGGLLPLDAAIRFGNTVATRVLLEYGAFPLAPLNGTDYDDIVEYARSHGQPGSEEVASLLAHALMTERIAATSNSSRAPDASVDALASGASMRGSRRRVGL